MKRLLTKLDWFSGMHLIFWLIIILPNLIPYDTSTFRGFLGAMWAIAMAWLLALFLYALSILIQLVIHIRNRQERTFLPLWLMLATVLPIIGFIYQSIQDKSWLAWTAFALSWIFYLLYLKCNNPDFLEKYRSNSKFRYLLWAGMIVGLVISFI